MVGLGGDGGLRDEGRWKSGNETRERETWGGNGGYFPEGKRGTVGRVAEGGDELMNNHHMVP